MAAAYVSGGRLGGTQYHMALYRWSGRKPSNTVWAMDRQEVESGKCWL